MGQGLLYLKDLLGEEEKGGSSGDGVVEVDLSCGGQRKGKVRVRVQMRKKKWSGVTAGGRYTNSSFLRWSRPGSHSAASGSQGAH